MALRNCEIHTQRRDILPPPQTCSTMTTWVTFKESDLFSNWALNTTYNRMGSWLHHLKKLIIVMLFGVFSLLDKRLGAVLTLFEWATVDAAT